VQSPQALKFSRVQREVSYKAFALLNDWSHQNGYRIVDWKHALGFSSYFIGINFKRGFNRIVDWKRTYGLGVVGWDLKLNFCLIPWRNRFLWTSSHAQTIYFVTVEESTGNVRRYWVRCGRFFLGMLVKRIATICEPETAVEKQVEQ
jgi:hypothetical protein